MTDEIKPEVAARTPDETRFVVLELSVGQTPDRAPKVIGVHDNEPAARKQAEEAALAEMGVRYGVYTKLGTTVAKKVAEWKGVS